MSATEKAKVQVLDASTRDPVGSPVEVQFNPTTLHIAMSNAIEPKKSAGSGPKQYLGTGSATLTVDLIFDTADDGTTDAPKSVLDRTDTVQSFMLPQGDAEKKQAPPLIRFHWGEIIFDGVVQTMNLDFELFSSQGTPLRAKIGLTILELNPRFEFKKAGPGAASAGSATVPGKAGLGGSGGIGLGVSASLGVSAGFSAGLSGGIGVGASFSAGVSIGGQTALALEGESAAEFAARVGVDPTAWRGIAVGQVDSTLSLTGGAEIDFAAGISAGAGIGVSVGVEAGASVSLEASFGLDNGARSDASAALTAPGFALSAAGGVAAAIQTVDIVRSETAVASTRRSFAAPAPPARADKPPSGAPARGLASIPSSTALAATSQAGVSTSPPRPDRPEQPRTALASTGMPSAFQQSLARPAPTPPVADPRATSFGYGVPLRPRLGGAAEQRNGALGGVIPLRPTPRGSGAPTSADPTAPPWASLSSASATSLRAPSSKPSKSCGCACSCRHTTAKS